MSSANFDNRIRSSRILKPQMLLFDLTITERIQAQIRNKYGDGNICLGYAFGTGSSNAHTV